MLYNIIPIIRLPYSAPKSFTYRSENKLSPGHVVEIDFSGRKATGIVQNEADDDLSANKIKDIKRLVHPQPLFGELPLRLSAKISSYFLASPSSIISSFFPAVPKRASSYAEYGVAGPSAPRQTETTFLLGDLESRSLTYIEDIRTCLKAGKQVLILCPDLIKLIERHDWARTNLPEYGIGTYSSHQTPTSQFKCWTEAISGQTKLFLGTRLAAFLPFHDLGLVIMEDPSSDFYKEWDRSPFLDSRIVVPWLTDAYGSDLIYSGTSWPQHVWPEKDGMRINDLRIASPRAYIADMRQESMNRDDFFISGQLFDAIEKTLRDGKQAILIVNRRGFGSAVICRDCGAALLCPACNNSMIDGGRGRARCLHCGSAQDMPLSCPRCSSPRIKTFGIGTGSVVRALTRHWPRARISAWDQDAARSKNSFLSIYQAFNTGSIDIIVGTQTALSLHSESTALIADINTDQSLNSPDWRASERSYHLMNEIVFSSNNARSILQTYQPDHPVFSALADERRFLDDLARDRKEASYPPFGRMIKLSYRGKSIEECQRSSAELIKSLKESGISDTRLLPARAYPKYYKSIVILFLSHEKWEKVKENMALKLPNNWQIDVAPHDFL